jgi:hypothetical protein
VSAWTDWSFVEAGAFVLLTLGVFTYGGAFKWNVIMGNVGDKDKGGGISAAVNKEVWKEQ